MALGKKSRVLVIILTATIWSICSIVSHAEILFDENFDNPSPSNWICGDGPYGRWTGISGESKSSCEKGSVLNGKTVIASTIESPGRGGRGKSFRINRANGFETGYVGNLSFDPSTKIFPVRKLHHRYFMRIPAGWNYYSPTSETKLSRYYIRETKDGTFGSSPSDVIRVSWYGESKDSARLRTYWHMDELFSTKTTGWYSFPVEVYLRDFDDDKWHCWEYMLDIQKDNIILELWIDGVSRGKIEKKTSHTSSNTTIRALGGLGWGNITKGSWEFPNNEIYSIEYDDFIVSTNYIGPGGSSSTSSSGSSSVSSTSSSSEITSAVPPPPGKPWVVK